MQTVEEHKVHEGHDHEHARVVVMPVSNTVILSTTSTTVTDMRPTAIIGTSTEARSLSL